MTLAQVLADAKAVDELKASGHDTKPLCGLPFAVKDNIDVVGYPTVAGTPALHGRQISCYYHLDRMRQHQNVLSHFSPVCLQPDQALWSADIQYLSCNALCTTVHVQHLRYACMRSVPHNICLHSELSCQAC